MIDIDEPDFFDAKLVARYKEVAEEIGVTIDERFLIPAKNTEFKIYRMLTCEHLIGRTIEDDEKIRREVILKEITSYKLCDYRMLFVACRFLENIVCERDQWSLNTGLDCIFEILEENSDLYIDVITEYLNEKAPLRLNGYCQIKYLIEHIGYEATYDLVSSKVFDKKNAWLSFIWECLPEESISEKVINDYKEIVLNNIDEDNPIVPTVQVISRYGEKDRDFKEKVLNAIVVHPKYSTRFLGYVHHDDDITKILHFFRDNINTLAKIYMNAIENDNYMDYCGKLFIKIFEQRPTIWKEYVDWVKDNIHRDGYEQKIFERIWYVEKWHECIDYAFKVLVDDMEFWIGEPAKLLFMKTQDNIVLERKKQWLFDKLHENRLDVGKCRKLIDVVVTVLPEWKLEFITEFLKDNKKMEDFEKLHLFPVFCSWSGSEVPLILEKIEFLKSLKDNLKGIDYIEHKKYLEERCRSFEKYKEEVELREYLENADYA